MFRLQLGEQNLQNLRIYTAGPGRALQKKDQNKVHLKATELMVSKRNQQVKGEFAPKGRITCT